MPGLFADGPEAYGVRAYLTPDEARQLVAEGSELFARFAGRMDDPRRRPAGASHSRWSCRGVACVIRRPPTIEVKIKRDIGLLGASGPRAAEGERR